MSDNQYYLTKSFLTCLKISGICLLIEILLVRSGDALSTFHWHYVVPASIASFFIGVEAAKKRKDEVPPNSSVQSSRKGIGP